MDDWKPTLASDGRPESLDLSPQEGFVLSRIDGLTSVRQLTFLTGFDRATLRGVLERLVTLGVVGHPPESQQEPRTSGGKGGGEEDDEASSPAGDARWRRRFHDHFRLVEVDERVSLARHAQGADLFALCFDPASKVVRAVLENPSSGLDHARLVASHHRSSTGLDALADEPQYLRDTQVRRHLYRNAQASDRLLRRLFERQRMGQIYRLAAGRDAADRVRNLAKRTFKKRFASGTAEERVSLVLKTEGRCLALLVGQALDAKAAALLCRRSLGSTLLIRNLLRWPATPPPLLQHLAKQPVVMRNPQLKNLLLRHPNAASLKLSV